MLIRIASLGQGGIPHVVKSDELGYPESFNDRIAQASITLAVTLQPRAVLSFKTTGGRAFM
jgi:hypothetical protein